jgi:hypothetical protein
MAPGYSCRVLLAFALRIAPAKPALETPPSPAVSFFGRAIRDEAL